MSMKVGRVRAVLADDGCGIKVDQKSRSNIRSRLVDKILGYGSCLRNQAEEKKKMKIIKR